MFIQYFNRRDVISSEFQTLLLTFVQSRQHLYVAPHQGLCNMLAYSGWQLIAGVKLNTWNPVWAINVFLHTGGGGHVAQDLGQVGRVTTCSMWHGGQGALGGSFFASPPPPVLA